MKKEITAVYERVKILCVQLKQRSRDSMDTVRLENLSVAVHQIKVCDYFEVGMKIISRVRI